MSGYSLLNGFSPGYSNKYDMLNQQHINQLREEILGRKEDISMKNKKLSAETNKRRRDLMNKKKAREDDEEKRRTEILAERRARIQEVTQRYQRGSSNKSGSNHHTHRSRGKRAVSAPATRPNPVDFEEALKAIRGSTPSSQYNGNDSGSAFLQKYGGYKQQSTEGTEQHSQSVRHIPTHSNSVFEQQLLQHQELLSQNQFSGGSSRNLPSHIKTNEAFTNNCQQPPSSREEELESIESLDSLESEQPSSRSHVINDPTSHVTHNSRVHMTTQSPHYSHNSHANNSNNTVNFPNSTSGGSGTYRQESPSVLTHPTAVTSTTTVSRTVVSTTTTNSTTSTAATVSRAISAANFVSGFQSSLMSTVQNPANQVSTTSTSIIHSHSVRHPEISQQESSQRESNQRESNLSEFNHQSAESSGYYLKSRTESQPMIDTFPSHAWGQQPDNLDVESSSQPLSINRPTHYQSDTNLATQALVDHSETASDSGAPRSILKRRGNSSAATAGLSRSHSTPSIRDSLEIAKRHMGGSAKEEMPKSAKKSVRFSEKSEPVFFHKGSSPSKISSGIPRPKLKQAVPANTSNSSSNNAVPHINESITPAPDVKSRTSKSQPNSSNTTASRGPVVASHGIVAAGGSNSRSAAAKGIEDIRLDKTPTDDEIEVLWDQVRNCLLESPASSVRSAPSELQHPSQHQSIGSTPQHQAFGSTPKQPVKKITASNINLIGGQGRGRLSAREMSSTPLLQRQRQNQRSFIQPNSRVATGPDTTALNPPPQAAAMEQTPVRSATEPSLSATSMVNNSPQDVSESMISYLTAEQLAHHDSMSEQEIMRAMSDSAYRQQLSQTSSGRPIVPLSALSLEEQRILQSLDRLNDKLKTVEDSQLSNHPQTGAQSQPMNLHLTVMSESLANQSVAMRPHPPHSARSFTTTARGFRGHKPLQNRPNGSATTSTSKQVRLY